MAMLNDLFAALALVFVLEGIVPFLNPGAVRKTVQIIAQLDDRTLRIGGLVFMLLGVGLLYLVR